MMHPPVFPSLFGHAAFTIISVLEIISLTKRKFPTFPFEILSMSCIILVCILQVLDEYKIGVLERLGIFGPDAHGGRDYFSYIKKSPIKFWYLTGETVETFQDIVDRMRLPIIALNRCRNGTQRRPRIQRLNISNRLLLVLIWLRRYPRLHTIGSMFKIDIASISRTVQELVPLLLENFSNEIEWPTENEWRDWAGHWKHFPTCVGIIDATIHEICRPSRRQALFYRGDKKKHFMSSTLIVTPDGMIVHCSAA